jgi:hypothetical protein
MLRGFRVLAVLPPAGGVVREPVVHYEGLIGCGCTTASFDLDKQALH